MGSALNEKARGTAMAPTKDLDNTESVTIDLESRIKGFGYPDRLPKLPSLKVLWDFAKQLSRDEDAARPERRSAAVQTIEP